jgi:ABC-2 type transport system permease protein
VNGDEFVPAARTRSEARRLFDMFAAYTRIDIIEDRMFPVSTILRYVAVLMPVFMYFFQADFLGVKNQFALTVIGVSCAAGLQDALVGFTSRLQYAQERGTLETYLVEPVSWRLIPVAMNVWRTVTGIFISVLMLLTGWLLGAEMDMRRFPLYLLVLVLGAVACNAVGVFAACFLVVFKRGEPIIALYGLAAALLGGSLFAITVLPGYIRWASYLVPHMYVISAARAFLVPDAPPGGIDPYLACVVLVLFNVVAFTFGARLFNRTLEYARRTGVLST